MRVILTHYIDHCMLSFKCIEMEFAGTTAIGSASFISNDLFISKLLSHPVLKENSP